MVLRSYVEVVYRRGYKNSTYATYVYHIISYHIILYLSIYIYIYIYIDLSIYLSIYLYLYLSLYIYYMNPTRYETRAY